MAKVADVFLNGSIGNVVFFRLLLASRQQYY
jgi:hypothetical protein